MLAHDGPHGESASLAPPVRSTMPEVGDRDTGDATMRRPEPAPVVLVAEDDYLERSLLRDVFAELGFRVRDARDGAEALAIAAREPVDLVLADLDMPHLDGLTLCRK